MQNITVSCFIIIKKYMAERSNKLNKTVNCFVLDRNKNSKSFVFAYISPENCGAFIYMNLCIKLTVILPKY